MSCPAEFDHRTWFPGMSATLPFLREIDAAVAQSSTHRRGEIVRHVTDLFLVSAEQYSDEEIALIDDVLVRLVATIEDSARALLAIRLGPCAKAPPKILSALACDDAIDIASPVLIQGEGLDQATLIRCATTKSQEHLLAISRRKSLTEAITDILVERGDQQIVLSTARNSGAKFSRKGFTTLVNRSTNDDLLAACVGARPDLPPQLFDKLLEAASDVVRRKLTAEHPRDRREVERAVRDATEQVRTNAGAQPAPAGDAPADSTRSLSGKSDAEKLQIFANAGRFEDVIATLAGLTKMPAEFIERKLKEDQVEFLLVLAKANGLPWQTTRTMLKLTAGETPHSPEDIKQYEASFARLTPATARKIMDFYRTRERAPAKTH